MDDGLSFEVIRRLALEPPDFFSKLNMVQKTSISPKNYAEITSTIYIMNSEKSEAADNAFKRQLEGMKSFNLEWARYEKANPGFSQDNANLKNICSGIFADGREVYIQTFEIRSIWEAAAKQYGDALERVYRNPEGIMEDDRRSILEMSRQVAKISDTLTRMAKKYAKNPNDSQAEG